MQTSADYIQHSNGTGGSPSHPADRRVKKPMFLRIAIGRWLEIITGLPVILTTNNLAAGFNQWLFQPSVDSTRRDQGANGGVFIDPSNLTFPAGASLQPERG